jgi:hypothetical protein
MGGFWVVCIARKEIKDRTDLEGRKEKKNMETNSLVRSARGVGDIVISEVMIGDGALCLIGTSREAHRAPPYPQGPCSRADMLVVGYQDPAATKLCRYLAVTQAHHQEPHVSLSQAVLT